MFKTDPFSESKRFLKFNLVLFLTLLVTCFAAIGLNYLVDPYGMFGTVGIPYISELKPEKSLHSRLFKVADIIRQKPRTILLGTSTVDFGLDSNHPLLSNYAPSYNLALLGANTYEVLHYLKHAAYNQPDLKSVIIGIDFTSFKKSNVNKVDYDEQRLEKHQVVLKDALSNLFSIDVTLASLNTILRNFQLHQEQPYDRFGNRSKRWSSTGLTIQDSQLYTFMLTLARVLKARIEKQAVYLDNFREIIAFCRDRNIEVKAFITPIHATLTEAYHATDQVKEIEAIEREIVKTVPIWDFSGFNSITTEPLCSQMAGYLDAIHYRKRVGDLMLRKMFQVQDSTVSPDFGYLMTAQNIEQHLRENQQRWQDWHNKNPQLVQLISSLQQVKGL